MRAGRSRRGALCRRKQLRSREAGVRGQRSPVPPSMNSTRASPSHVLHLGDNDSTILPEPGRPRSRASKTWQRMPLNLSSRAQARPAGPAPTMATGPRLGRYLQAISHLVVSVTRCNSEYVWVRQPSPLCRRTGRIALDAHPATGSISGCALQHGAGSVHVSTPDGLMNPEWAHMGGTFASHGAS